MTGTLNLLVGTSKGAVILSGDENRQQWTLSGLHCDGWPINQVIGDPESGRLWAAGGNDWWGTGVWRSEDGGATWALSKLANGQMDEWLRNDPEMAAYMGNPVIEDAPFTGEVEAIWSLRLAGKTLYAGGKPGMLFSSTDGGETWDKVSGICDHPERDSWQPGGAGLTVHTIVTDPDDAKKLWLGVSSAGVFATEDGGKTWERRNRLSNTAPPGPEHAHADGTVHGQDTEIGLCVHNMVRAPGAADEGGDLLYQQNHHGVFRSPDGGRSWHDISAGLPSTFGFPVVVHPGDAKTIWTLPLNGDSIGRYPPDASAKVWKSVDGGDSWTAQTNGLPHKDCFFTVLRQAMDIDGYAKAGIYFGTNSGSIFATRDEGDSWQEIARHLPTVLSVDVLQTA